MTDSITTSLKNTLLLTWFADDFTGAAAVLEVLAFAGVQSILFLQVPTEEQLNRYSHLQAIGVASTARAQSPEWMAENLPAVFDALQALNPQLLHYKICTTLDSSPTIGSIGRAIEIGNDRVGSDAIPVLVAAPQMRRYQFFGHLFASLGDAVYRLDRHPVMARHPVTRMTESDVAMHISAQSERLSTSFMSIEDIAAAKLPEQPQESKSISVFAMDCIDELTELAAGKLLWERRQQNRFVVGSQGVEFALVRHWIQSGLLKAQSPPKSVGRSNGMVTVSGSVSPTTAEQISWSRANGFSAIRFNVCTACEDGSELENEIIRVVNEGITALEHNIDPLIFTAEGPDDPAVTNLIDAVSASGKAMSEVNKSIGLALGTVLHRMLVQSNVRRAVISGGDTSGYVIQQLGIIALSALAPTIPGASLSRAHADGPMDGLELALKGGQMGSADYFGWIRDGGGAR